MQLRATLSTLLLTLAVLAGPAACDTHSETDDAAAAEEAARQAVQDAMVGTWRTDCLPTGADSWGTFEFVHAPAQGSFTYTMHGDPECSSALAEFNLYSEQIVGAPVATAEGARELDILYDRLSATALVDDLAAAFEQAGCGGGPVTVGEPIDISETGCFSFASIADCPGDFDIMRIDGDQYRNGVRTANMCSPSGRPTELNEFYFYRVD